MLAVIASIYGFLAMFILSSLRRNRQEERMDAPVLTLASHGLMGASAVGGMLLLGAAAWPHLPL